MPEPHAAQQPRDVAVVGSGAAGLVAAYVLAKHDRVTLFEKDSRLGGHAHTHEVQVAGGRTVHIDSGFIVHNDRTYPTVIRLFSELGVRTQDTDMSMSVRADRAGLEYSGGQGMRGLIPTVAALAKPRYLGLLAQVPRFHRAARAVLQQADTGVTMADFLAEHRFGSYFTEYFVTPLVAAVWSCDPQLALQYPAHYLFRFLDHHGMLTVTGSPVWRTVVGGSARYVEKIAATLHAVHANTPIHSVAETADEVIVTGPDGPQRFDAVVIATHPQQSLKLLAEPSATAREILGAMPYSLNPAQLHTDESLLPKAHRARASWNYLVPPASRSASGVVVSYDLTRLMRLHDVTDRRFVVTLGGADLVDPRRVIAEMTYEHPIYTPQSVAAQQRLPELTTARMAFAGAYHGWGFHEDAALSGLQAARALGGHWPDHTRVATETVAAS